MEADDVSDSEFGPRLQHEFVFAPRYLGNFNRAIVYLVLGLLLAVMNHQINSCLGDYAQAADDDEWQHTEANRIRKRIDNKKYRNCELV